MIRIDGGVLSEGNGIQQKNGERISPLEPKGTMLKTIHIIGLGLGPDNLGPSAIRIIEMADVLAGSDDNLALFPEHSGGRLVIKDNVSAWLEDLAETAKDLRVVVLTTGDPNFYGVADRVVQRVGMENVRIHPNITEVQAAFARLKEPWAQVKVVSLENGGERALFAALKESSRVAVLADSFYSPQLIAEMLLARGQKSWRICIMENLGTQDSKVSFFRLQDTPSKEFSHSRITILLKKDEMQPLTMGLKAAELGLKDVPVASPEIRAVFLAHLRLEPGMILWDLGDGASGLGLTATAILTSGKVIAVRKDPWNIENLENNRTRFGAANLDIRYGEAPALLPGMPDPDRIFVDADGATAAEFVRLSIPRLPEGGVIVAWSSSSSSLEMIFQKMLVIDPKPELVRLLVSRTSLDWDDHAAESPQPIWLISGTRGKRSGPDQDTAG